MYIITISTKNYNTSNEIIAKIRLSLAVARMILSSAKLNYFLLKK